VYYWLREQRLGRIASILLAAFGASPQVCLWNFVIMTEGFTISGFVMALAVLLILVRKLSTITTRSLAACFVSCIVVLVGLRDGNVSVAATTALLFCFAPPAQVDRLCRFFILICMVGITAISLIGASVGGRGDAPSVHIIHKRLLRDSDALLLLEKRGLPLVRQMSSIQGPLTKAHPLLTSPDVRAWVRKNFAYVYVIYLSTHPVGALEVIMSGIYKSLMTRLRATFARIGSIWTNHTSYSGACFTPHRWQLPV
jgi:hypothetical protein